MEFFFFSFSNPLYPLKTLGFSAAFSSFFGRCENEVLFSFPHHNNSSLKLQFHPSKSSSFLFSQSLLIPWKQSILPSSFSFFFSVSTSEKGAGNLFKAVSREEIKWKMGREFFCSFS